MPACEMVAFQAQAGRRGALLPKFLAVRATYGEALQALCTALSVPLDGYHATRLEASDYIELRDFRGCDYAQIQPTNQPEVIAALLAQQPDLDLIEESEA